MDLSEKVSTALATFVTVVKGGDCARLDAATLALLGFPSLAAAVPRCAKEPRVHPTTATIRKSTAKTTRKPKAFTFGSFHKPISSFHLLAHA